jgi:small-conductance mechanosensitive channel
MIPEAIMNKSPVDITYLVVLLPQIQTYFYSHILVWNMLVQLLVAGVAYVLARTAAMVVRPWFLGEMKRHPGIEQALGHLAKLIAARLVTPIIAVVLLWFVYRMAHYFQWPNHGLSIVLSLSLAWVIVRLLTGEMKNRTLAKIVSVIIWTLAALNIVHVLVPLLTLLDSIKLILGDVNLSILTMIKGGLILAGLFWLSQKISKFFDRWIKTVQNVTPSVQVLLHKLLSLALFTLVIAGVLYYMGINLTALAVFSGGIGLGIGFGLQKVFANLISGFIILTDKSIKPGDVIQMGDTYGWINYLGGRYVSVVTRDATEHLIPNEDLIINPVINWSYSNNLLRLKIPIGIGYDSDLQQAMALMLEAAAEAPRVLIEPKPACLLMDFGDNAVNFQLRVWIRDPQHGIANVKSQVLLGVWERFQKHGIDLPFPQRVVHHKSVPELEVAIRPQPPSAGADTGVDLRPV